MRGTMAVAGKSLLDRIVREMAGLKDGAPEHAAGSILLQAARAYGARPVVVDAEASVPSSGFDPAQAALYEANVEMTYLVAAAEGPLEDDARAALQWVIAEAS